MDSLCPAQFEQMCRACMSCVEDCRLQSIFDYVDDYQNKQIQLHELLNTTVRQLPKIEIMDALPKCLCSRCVEKLRAFHYFQNICINADFHLRKLIASSMIQDAEAKLADPLQGECEFKEFIKEEIVEEDEYSQNSTQDEDYNDKDDNKVASETRIDEKEEHLKIMSSKNKSKKSYSKDIDFNALIEPIKKCALEKRPTKSTAEAYSIPRTTLQRYVKKVQEKFGDIKDVDDGTLLDFVRECGRRWPSNQIFSMVQEADLVVYISECDEYCYGISINELRELAYRFAKKRGVHLPDCWIEHKKASIDWCKKFRRRHPKVCLRAPKETPEQEPPQPHIHSSFSLWNEVSPLQSANPEKPSNYGSKPRQIGVITPSDVLVNIKIESDEHEAMKSATETTPAKISAKRFISKLSLQTKLSPKRAKKTSGKTTAKAKESPQFDEDLDY